MKEIGLLLLVIIVLWILWFIGGGPERFNPKDGPLLPNPTPVDYGY